MYEQQQAELDYLRNMVVCDNLVSFERDLFRCRPISSSTFNQFNRELSTSERRRPIYSSLHRRVASNEQPIDRTVQTNHTAPADDTTELNTRLVQLQETLTKREEK